MIRQRMFQVRIPLNRHHLHLQALLFIGNRLSDDFKVIPDFVFFINSSKEQVLNLTAFDLDRPLFVLIDDGMLNHGVIL